MKFRRKMTLISVSLSISLAFIMVGLFYFFAHMEIKNRTIDTFQMQGHMIDRELERLFFERIGDIEALGGRIQLSLDEGASSRKITESLLAIKNTYRMYDEIFFLYPDKRKIAGTKKALLFKKISNPLILKSEVEPKTIFGYAEEGDAISFVKSLHNKKGKMVGILVANIPISYISDTIKQVSHLGRYNYLEEIELFGSNGQIIYSQNKAEKSKSIDLSQIGFHENDTQMWSVTHSLETGEFNPDQSWTLVVRVNKSDVYKEARVEAIFLASIFSASIILFSFFAYRLFASIARPIEEASRVVLEVGDGHFDAINKLEATDDEIGNLIKSLKTMNKNIAQLVADLNKSLGETKHQLDLRDEFISVVAHELRTPITPVSFQIQFLKKLIEKEKFKGHSYESNLKKIYEISFKELNVLNSLIDSLLDVSSISFGKFAYNFQPDTDLVVILKKDIERCRESFVVEIEENLPESLKGFWDSAKIEIVVNNLLSNAIKYGEGKKIEVKAVLHDPKTVRFTIKDHGIGIRPEDFERIFYRFERGVSYKNYGGMGLGLYLSRKILEGHGGKIWVTSAPNLGTTFYVDLPTNV